MLKITKKIAGDFTLRPPRLILAAIALGTLPTAIGATSLARFATILPEIQKQLADGRRCVISGDLDVAIAHANLVLVSEQVAVCPKYDRVSASQKKICARALNASFAAWESALDQSIHFHLEDDPNKADIVINFKFDVRMGSEPVAGFTNWKRAIKSEGGKVTETSFKADVQVRTHDLNHSQMPFECIRQETEHELGHILGLEDSDTEGDIMAPLNLARPVSYPRSYEVNAVQKVRDEARRIRDEALAKRKG